jgi:hypothetical protein
VAGERTGHGGLPVTGARLAAAVLCLVAGVMHVLGGRFLVLLFGIGYLVAALALFRRWSAARGIAVTVATARALGTLLLLLLKVPALIRGSMTPGTGTEMLRDLFWLAVNLTILLVTPASSRPDRDGSRGGCV